MQINHDENVINDVIEDKSGSEDSPVKYAGFGIRLLAYLLDMVIIFLGLLLVRAVLFVLSLFLVDILSKNILFQYSLSDIILYICKVSYFIGFTYVLKATPGKRICKLKVISSSEEPLTFFNVLYRETIGRYLSNVCFGIGYLLIFIDHDKQSLHDMLSDTKVVCTT